MTRPRRLELVSYSGMGQQLNTPAEWARACDAFATWLRASGKPESTVYLRMYQVRRFAITIEKRPFDVVLDDLAVYLSAHRWSPNTRRATRSGLRSFYRWAHATGRMDHNPAELLPVVPAPLGRPRPAPEEVVQLGLHIADERVRLMIRLAATGGLRCCEIAVVHSSDLRPSLDGWSLIAHGKGRRVRTVPISDHLADEIARADGFLFPGQIDGHLSAAYVSKLVSRALPEGVTAHMLRHRYASVTYAADRDIRAVQELLGHASVATTQVYTAVPDGALRRAALAAAA